VVIVNIYDPMDRIVYRHVGQPVEPLSTPVVRTGDVHRLPIGYPNGSPGTYLGHGRRTPQAA
jgi:hypothetical protein